MTGNYPTVPAEVIVSGSNGADDASTSGLDQFLKNEDRMEKSLIGNSIAAKQWLEDNGILSTVALPQSESVPSAAAKLEHPVIPPLPQKNRRPNYFVCQRITNPEIMKGVQEIQSKIMKAAPPFSACFVDSTSLHMTFCTLTLDTDSEVIYSAKDLEWVIRSLASRLRCN